MGLQEKKWIRSIKEDYLVDFQKELDLAAGTNIPIDVEWESFPSVNELKFIPSVGIQRILNSIKEICKDADGKEAIQEEIKNILIKHVADDAENNKNMSIENNTFILAAGFGGSQSNAFNDSSIKEFLENNL